MRNEIQSRLETNFQGFNLVFIQKKFGAQLISDFYEQMGQGGGVTELIFNRPLINAGGPQNNGGNFTFLDPLDRSDPENFQPTTGDSNPYEDIGNINRNDFVGVAVGNFALTQGSETEERITLSTNLAMHELLHALGASHEDSMGPIGLGLTGPAGSEGSLINGPSVGIVGQRSGYRGPVDAFESDDHHVGVGTFSPGSTYLTNREISERSAIKVRDGEVGQRITEQSAANDSIDSAQPIVLHEIDVPNTISTGMNAGKGNSGGRFIVDTQFVFGELTQGDPGDFYKFDGHRGDTITIAVHSQDLDVRYEDVFALPVLRVYDSDGNTIAGKVGAIHGAETAIWDFHLPESDTYAVEVKSAFIMDYGNYEMFFYRLRGGDFNLDGAVDATDVDRFKLQIGQPATRDLLRMDLDQDGYTIDQNGIEVAVSGTDVVLAAPGEVRVYGEGTITIESSVNPVTGNPQPGDHELLITELLEWSRMEGGVEVSGKGTFNGDINLDGKVSVEDFAIQLNNLNSTNAGYADGDLNADGVVDFSDTLIFTGNIGNVANP